MPPEQRRVKKAEEFVQTFEKTVRSFKMYPPGHPRCEDFLSQSYTAFSSFLGESSPMDLTVDHTSLILDDRIVYSNPDHSESLAFALYRDGIRQISFREGISKVETEELVKAFSREFDTLHIDDDLATCLWEKDLEHVSIIVTDGYFDDFLPEEIKDAADVETVIRERLGIRSIEPPELKDRLLTRPLDDMKLSTIPLKEPFLNPDKLRTQPHELHNLEKLLEEEGKNLYFEDMLEIVLSILINERAAGGADVFISLFKNMLLLFLSAGPEHQALHLVRRIRRLTDGSGDLPAPVTAQLDDFLHHLSSPEIIDTLAESLHGGKLHDFDSLAELTGLFPPSAVSGLVSLFGAATSMKARKSLCRGLSMIGRNNLDALTAHLGSDQWYAVRNIAYSLGLIGTPEVIPHLGNLLFHNDSRVRKEALRSLSRVGGKLSANFIARALDHDDEETRRQALYSLPKVRNPVLFQKILGTIRSAEFDGRSLEERERYYRLLGLLGGEHLIPDLRDQLAARRWFTSRRQRDGQYLAATALAALNSAVARDTLRDFLPRADEKTAKLIRSCLLRPARTSPARPGGL